MFELMRALPLFKGFPDADLAQLAASLAEQHLEAGEVLFWQGEEGHECYVILAGELEVIAHPGRSEVRLEVRQAAVRSCPSRPGDPWCARGGGWSARADTRSTSREADTSTCSSRRSGARNTRATLRLL